MAYTVDDLVVCRSNSVVGCATRTLVRHWR